MSSLDTVYQAVIDGKVDATAAGVEAALAAGEAAEAIVNEALIRAMDRVGEQFGAGELFIPQVLWSAKSMQAGMNVLKPHLAGDAGQHRGRVVIGTAKGDIHDIGKNLVSMMLQGAGFEVTDLGVDVSAERFLEKAEETGADVIAISALLTTTMVNIGDVVSLVRAKSLSNLKILVGGAPLSEAFRIEIGADAYGYDASDAVRKMRELMGK